MVVRGHVCPAAGARSVVKGVVGVVFVPRVRVLISPQCEIGLLIFGGLLASSRVGRAREACALGGDGGVCVMRAAL